jgi:hypothetical protein
MENQRDDLVVILAGYKEPMDKFYESNPGLSSRIANHIDQMITHGRIIKNFEVNVREQQYQLTPAAEAVSKTTSMKRKKRPLSRKCSK